jgi:hypothetical protein
MSVPSCGAYSGGIKNPSCFGEFFKLFIINYYSVFLPKLRVSIFIPDST